MPLQIGFIGCGGIANMHARQLALVRGARIVACADVVQDAADAFAQQHGAEETYTDPLALVKSDAVQAVYVCTPTGLHNSAVTAAAKAGKHVFCEKPLAMKPAEARRMVEACRQAGVRLTVGFVRRFSNEWLAMRKLVVSGKLGRPVVWHSIFHSPGPDKAWFNDAKLGGGPLMDGAIHNYDFALQMFGQPFAVQAAGHCWVAEHTAPDTAHALLRFRSGDDLVMSWSWGLPAGTTAQFLHQVVGPKGSVVWGAPPELLPEGFDPDRQGALTLTGPGNKQRAVLYKLNDMFLDQAKHVVRHLSAGKQPLVTGEDGVASVAVGDAVLRSARSTRTVRFPD